MALELQAPGRRGGEVVLARAGVRPAVDHRHAHHAAVVAQGDPRAARQRLVGDAELRGAQPATAAQPVAVEPGAVPRCERVAVHVEPPEAVLAGRAAAHAHAGARAHRATHAVAQDVAPVRVGAITIERGPAPMAPDLQRDRRPGGPDHAAHDARRPARTLRWRSLTPTFEAVAVGVVPWGHRQTRRRAWPPRRDRRYRARRRTARHANRDWASRRGPPSVVGRPTRRLWVTTAGHRAAAPPLVPHPAGHRALPARRSNGRSIVAKRRWAARRQMRAVLAQLGEREPDAALGGAQRDLLAARDLVGGQAAPVGEHERLALGLWQAPQRLAHHLARVTALGGDGGRVLGALALPLATTFRRSDARPAAWPSRHRSSARERAIMRR